MHIKDMSGRHFSHITLGNETNQKSQIQFLYGVHLNLTMRLFHTLN